MTNLFAAPVIPAVMSGDLTVDTAAVFWTLTTALVVSSMALLLCGKAGDQVRRLLHLGGHGSASLRPV